MPEGGALERMRVAGDVAPATEDPGDLPEPVVLDGVEPPSSVLAPLRRNER